MKITRITAHQVDLPLIEGSYSWSSGKSIRAYDSDGGSRRDRCGSRRAWRGLPARARLSAGLRGRRSCRACRARTASHRLRSARHRRRQSADGRAHERPPLREVAARHGLLGPARIGDRHLRVDPARRPPGRGGEMLSRDLAGHAGAHGRACRRRIAPKDSANSRSRSAAIPRSTSNESAASHLACNQASSWSPMPIPAGCRTRRRG